MKKFLTVKQAMKATGLSERTIRRRISEHEGTDDIIQDGNKKLLSRDILGLDSPAKGEPVPTTPPDIERITREHHEEVVKAKDMIIQQLQEAQAKLEAEKAELKAEKAKIERDKDQLSDEIKSFLIQYLSPPQRKALLQDITIYEDDTEEQPAAEPEQPADLPVDEELTKGTTAEWLRYMESRKKQGN